MTAFVKGMVLKDQESFINNHDWFYDPNQGKVIFRLYVGKREKKTKP
jgi:hypothetical protein